MLTRSKKEQGFAVCIRKYRVRGGPRVQKVLLFRPMYRHDLDAEANDLIRVIDESGEDYVYPARFFQKLTLPGEVRRGAALGIVM